MCSTQGVFAVVRGAIQERLTLLRGEEVALRVDGESPADPEGLRAALDMARVEVWSGVEVGGFEEFHEMDLWLASQAKHFALLVAQQSARDSGLVSRGTRMGAKTILDGASGDRVVGTLLDRVAANAASAASAADNAASVSPRER